MLAVLCAGVAAAAWPSGVLAEDPPAKPNVLFIISDQHQNRLWQMNNSLVKTPNLMLLAEQGMVVQNAISQTPVCSPYRGMLMSGQYPRTTGMTRNNAVLMGNGSRLSEVTASLGYRNGYMGKWHLSGARNNPNSALRQIVTAPFRHAFTEMWNGYEAMHKYLSGNTGWYDENDSLVTLTEYRNFQEADEVMAFLDDHTTNHADDPFFAVWSMAPPHNPYNQYDPSQPSPDFAYYRTLLDDSANLPPNYHPGAGVSLNDIAGYYAMCTGIDTAIGEVFDHLDTLGLSENTIVVYTSDHGDMLGAQGLRLKQKPWRESNNVPFVVRYPGVIPAGRVSDMLLGSVDLMPTLLGLMGQAAAIPAGIEGMDLSGALRGQQGAAEREHLWIGMTDLSRSSAAAGPANEYTGVVTKRHTYASFKNGVVEAGYGANGGYVLYDNINDPWQMENLVDGAGSGLLQAELYDRLVAANAEAHETPDIFPLPPRPTVAGGTYIKIR
jgi:arylsulfatase A-like enzyme